MDTVIIVWDRNGKFFQVWTQSYNGDGVEHGKDVAAQIGGSYKVIWGWTRKSVSSESISR